MRAALTIGSAALCLALVACKTPTAAPAARVSPVPALTAAEGPPGDLVGAVRIQRPEQLIGGPSAQGQVGDYLLYNDKIKVVISDLGHTAGGAASGGNILDVDLARGGHDALDEVLTFLDNTFPRQLIYEAVTITGTGAGGGPARISAAGRDSMNPDLVGVTHYILEPGQAQLKIVSELTNTSASTLVEYELGDAIQWGRTQHFAPGHGDDLPGKYTQGPWVAGLSDDVSYGWTAMGVTLRGPHGNGWSDVIVGKVDLPPGGTASWERYLTVGTGDVASMLPMIFQIRGELSEAVTGSVAEEGSALRIPDAVITASFGRSGRPYATARTDARGAFQMPLPPDEYVLSVHHKSRQALGAQKVDLLHGPPPPVGLAMSAPGKLRFKVEGAGGTGLPAKLAVVGVGDTVSPDLGPRYTTEGALNYLFSLTGFGEVEIPPGVYDVTASRGIEYGIDTQRLTITGGQTVDFAAKLEREVDTRGYLAADLHQSSLHSPDCSVSLKDVVIANLAEGVEVMVGADEDFIPDYASTLASLGIEAPLKVLSGVTVTLPQIGSVTAFPLPLKPGEPRGGAPIFAEGASPTDILTTLRGAPEAPRVVQVNHPREGPTSGYFDIYDLDPSTGKVGDEAMSLAFNTIEVFNGKRLRAASTVLRDWFLLLNQGYLFTATGASDSHTTVTQERGYPRTFIGVSAETPTAATDAEIVHGLLAARDVIVTNGPFIRFSANGARVGQQLAAPGGKVELKVKVEAPRWIQVDRVEIVANGEVIRTLEAPHPDAVVKLDTTETFVVPRDTWFVVVARGSRSMDPVVPQYKGTTITPLAFTNPIWVVVDGDGAFTPLFPPPEGDPAGRRGNVEIPLLKAAP